jgi:hypothetical protein
VTTNLEAALRHLRYEDRGRVLWVDALCINQRDVRERNSQVKKMRSIYTGAKKVVVWLGPEDDAKVALNFCKELREIRQLEVSEVYGDGNSVQTFDPWAIWKQYKEDEPKWKACEGLFIGRSWWTRTWIIQEVLHGVDVEFQIGKLVAKLDSLHSDYLIYITMKARANRADITFTTDTQLDRAIAHTLSREESAWQKKREEEEEDADDIGLVAMDTIAALRGEINETIKQDTGAERETHVPSMDSGTIQKISALEALQRREVAVVFDSTFRYFKGFENTVSLSTIASSRSDIVYDPKSPNLYTYTNRSKSYSLADLLRIFRGQQASDPRDKVYAFLGLASDRIGIPVDYKASKKAVYVRTARMLRLLSGLLSVLLAVESPDRPIEQNQDLPSWVPDWTTKQMLISRFMEELSFEFSANDGLSISDIPSLPPSPYHSPESDALPVPVSNPNSPYILPLHGIYVGIIMGTYISTLMHDSTSTTMCSSSSSSAPSDDHIKLITYSRSPAHRFTEPVILSKHHPWPPPPSPSPSQPHLPNLANTSWGPWHAKVGDIIIVAAGSRIPLVLRRLPSSPSPSPSPSTTNTKTEKEKNHENHDDKCKYLFVGGCILIDAQLRKLGEGNLRDEKGFSGIMFGSAWKGLREGKGTVEVEDFWLV